MLGLVLLSAVTGVRAAAGETVILLHGLGRSRWSVYRVAQALRQEGYQVINPTCPSRAQTIEELGQ
jgi:triacylglycerol lipase